MPTLTLRTQAGSFSPDDLVVQVKDNTFEYLLTSSAPTIRVSSFLDRDWPTVKRVYAEVFVSEECPFVSTVVRLIPGSRTRTGIQLPGPMHEGEQLTIEVTRASVSQPTHD